MYLLLGCGDVGLAAANKLKESGADITIVDRDPKRVKWLREMGYNAIEGDFSSQETLENAEISRAEVILLLTSNYRGTERTLVAIDSLKKRLGIDPVIVARAEDDSEAEELKRLGATEALPTPQILASSVFGKASELELMTREKRLRALLKQVKGKVAIILQTNPDPDSIACGMALKRYVKIFGLDADLIYGGVIGHPQNRAMVNLFGLELIPAEKAKFDGYSAYALVDVATHANCALPKEIEPTIVIDHHSVPSGEVKARYQDIAIVGAASTLLANYIKYAGAELDSPLATALAFGILRDTLNFTRGTTELDFKAFEFLLPKVNSEILTKLHYPAYSPDTLYVLSRAIKASKVKGGYLVSNVGEAKDRDAIAYASDYLLRREGVMTTLVYGVVKDTVYVSARTSDVRANIGELLKSAFSDIGSAGGHATMAGAQIPLKALGKQTDKRSTRAAMDYEIGAKFLETVGVAKRRKKSK